MAARSPWAPEPSWSPVRGIVKGPIEPLADGARSRVTLVPEFEAHGIGKLLVPLVIRRAARGQVSQNEQRLKDVLERHA
jgi:hypothetical protein